jgi:hypothetical protein
MRILEEEENSMVGVLDDEKKQQISKAYMSSLKYNYENILKGRILVIDPSSGGATSLPAYSIIERGKIIETAEVEVSAKFRKRAAHVAHRLREIGVALQERFRDEHFDVLALELIYHNPSASTVMRSFQSLNMSIGAIHASISADYRIVVPPWEWHQLRPASYKKTDIGDVKLMAKTLIKHSRALALEKKMTEMEQSGDMR